MSRLNRSFIGLAVAFAAMLIVADTAAAQNPNFAGNWTLNTSESDLGSGGGGRGGMGGRVSASMAITHEGNTITITTQQAGRDGSTREVSREFITDGESHTTEGPRGPTTNTATWKEGQLHVVSVMTFNMRDQTMELTANLVYAITDGKLVVVTTRENMGGGGTTITKAVYDKKD